MNKTVRDNYPVADLPENLREGFPLDGSVSVTIQLVPPKPAHVPTLKELLSVRRPPYRSTADIAEELRRERDAWDD